MNKLQILFFSLMNLSFFFVLYLTKCDSGDALPVMSTGLHPFAERGSEWEIIVLSDTEEWTTVQRQYYELVRNTLKKAFVFNLNLIELRTDQGRLLKTCYALILIQFELYSYNLIHSFVRRVIYV